MTFAADKQYKVDVAGVTYGMDAIRAGEIAQALFDAPGIGGTCCATLTLSLWPTEPPPRAAEIRPYARAADGAWEALGVFWIDQRTDIEGRLDITAYDVMMKAEARWTPDGTAAFPMSMQAAAEAIAAAMGTALDARCAFRETYTVNDPAGIYTMREVLGFIAAAHAGNWIATAAGELLLVPLFGAMPPETHYLIEESGDAVTFGGVRILV